MARSTVVTDPTKTTAWPVPKHSFHVSLTVRISAFTSCWNVTVLRLVMAAWTSLTVKTVKGHTNTGALRHGAALMQVTSLMVSTWKPQFYLKPTCAKQTITATVNMTSMTMIMACTKVRTRKSKYYKPSHRLLVRMILNDSMLHSAQSASSAQPGICKRIKISSKKTLQVACHIQ